MSFLVRQSRKNVGVAQPQEECGWIAQMILPVAWLVPEPLAKGVVHCQNAPHINHVTVVTTVTPSQHTEYHNRQRNQ